MYERVYNFSAGPSVLPEEVLLEASKEMLNYKGSGMSVMEMSHRSKEFMGIAADAEKLLRELMNVPANYKILFLQGGASTQFAMIPLNLFSNSKTADYVDTGAWSTKAIKEAKKYGTVNVLASSKESTYSYIPKLDKSAFSKDADYFHITTNNTIYGTRFTPDNLPDTGDVPLVADMSSNILSEVYDVSKFGLIYAGAQKNMGPAGVTAVIIREDLIGKAMDITPTMLDYKIHADADSLYNTPPCYSIYMCMLVFKWLKEKGGVAAMEKINREKSQLLYDYLDQSAMFKATVAVEDRSLMNVPFVTGNDELDAAFIKEAVAKGFVNLKGHRSVGGMRASIYNAMPVEGVKALVEFMKEFEAKNK
ncbi:3-phosphoserine/phosphohydroxythreonine transaminase [Alkalibacter saccharofermentans]|uniref:Phosphoserine aminotransferase n=1 Tax=Alkalibacter saccharofermentans DSM 14828 TaxID=1120975 RepID=A0A1M4WVM4_9FIRM|nr:3-phosphoserine/phosphohydroxythreonine transaminase [Alkalibacter saccharofermentans]SHE85207.1 phosphoserine aminotransferase apoenzyme [Alkalibacter saccharofermentans DSM 14828]